LVIGGFLLLFFVPGLGEDHNNNMIFKIILLFGERILHSE